MRKRPVDIDDDDPYDEDDAPSFTPMKSKAGKPPMKAIAKGKPVKQKTPKKQAAKPKAPVKPPMVSVQNKKRCS